MDLLSRRTAFFSSFSFVVVVALVLVPVISMN